MLFVTIWPIFALICLGFVLSRSRFPDPDFWPAAERINYFLLFPALLVANLADAPVGDPDLIRLGGAIVLTIGIAAAVLMIVRKVSPMPAARFGPVLQGVIRFNTYLGLAITASLAGDAGLERAAVLLAVAVPLVNVLSILALSEAGKGRGIRGLLRPIVRNPLILGCVVGIFIAVSGTGLPFGIGRLLNLLAEASLPLGLLCVGAALKPGTIRHDVGALASNAVLRLLAMPILAVLVARLFDLGQTETMILVIFAAIPTAPSAYVLTRQLRGDGPFMAGIVTAQTLGSVASIPLVLALLGFG